MSSFTQISLVVVLATSLAFVAKLLRQPLLIGYLSAGIIIGPSVLNLLHSQQTFELFSKLGIATLLFIVGLHLSPKVVKDLGRSSLFGGLGQIIFTSLAGFALARLLGLPFIASFYVAIALTLSSTIIVLKLLSDKSDLNSLYGRLTVGFLLIQDIVATLLILVLPTFSSQGNFLDTSLPLLFQGLLLTVFLFIAIIFLLPHLSRLAASSSELLFLFSLSWGLGIATLFQHLGFSVETGALVAGVSLSATPFATEIGSRLRPLRDFFIVLFFILLGSQLTFQNLPSLIYPALLLSAFVILISPLIVIVVLNLLGYHRRIGFLTGLGLAQISEFSLILGQIGFRLGHLNQDVLSLITLVGLITITLSSYLVLHSERLYSLLAKPLSILELIKRRPIAGLPSQKYDTLLFGFHRIGQNLLKTIKQLTPNYLIIDFDPKIIRKLADRNLPHLYGDAEDPEFLQELDLKNLKLVISTIPDFTTNHFLITTIRQHNQKAILVVLSHYADQTMLLYQAGASYVLMPHYLGAQYTATLLKKYHLSLPKYAKAKQNHLRFLARKNS